MLKKSLSILLLMLLMSGYNAFSQDRNVQVSQLPAPKMMNPLPPSVQAPSPNAYYSRAFAYNAYGGSIALGPFKMWLNGTGMTSLATDPSSANFVQAGSFCGTDGFWYGVRYGTQALVKIDTSTGTITQVATVTGASSTTGLGWDFTTNTMYALNYVASASNVGTLNLTTGVYTPLAGTMTTGLPIDMAVSNNGTIYVNVITAPTTNTQIYTVNKTTGVFTALPSPSGYNGNYAQGMSWDHGVDTGYLFAYNYSTSAGELRKIDAATGITTLIASIVMEADGAAIPGFPGPQISHTPLPNTQNLTGPYVVNCVITGAGSPISTGKIFWSRNSPTITDSVSMTNPSGNNWTGNIPGNGTVATYRYYLKAVDGLGRVGYAPGGAPASLYMFLATSTDTSKPVITHTPIGNTPKVNWPATVNCSVTEPFGIDSVWVRWYKNTGAYTRFNLAHGSGNNWSAAFNSDTSQVVPGDHIYYRIVARSASAQHTMDSTALLTFDIINQVTVCIGTGTTQSVYPFTTYWEDGRTDMLFTSAELVAGGAATGYIQKIGFSIVNADPAPLNALNVKMQWTTATSLTGFINSGWMVCYNNVYTLPGTGWQYITLTTPFPWAVGNNLLVEVCYNNASYTSYSYVNATTATGMMVGYYTDLPTGDGCTAAWTATSLTYRSNTCFIMNPGPLESGNSHTVIPGEYKLSQNYPNPFNPITKIDYALPKNGLVSLKIFDVLGREVKTLVNETKNAGYYTVDFNAAEFSSGVYFYRLESNGFTDVKKMMLIK